MTPPCPPELVEEYRAALEAELALLDQLRRIAEEQRLATTAGDLSRFSRVADERDALMRNLVAIEEGLRNVRASIGKSPDDLLHDPLFAALAERHRDAAQTIADILSIDRASMSALADADLARRSALASLERGESTLAAYRRVLAPPPEHARLVNRIG